MAKSCDDAGQWPLRDKGDNNNNNNNNVVVDTDPFGFPSEFPYELGISSPVESVAGSTETESSDEEEDFFKALTRRLSQSSLHDSRKHHPLTSPIITGNKPESLNLKTRGLAVSPQSTLSGIGSWSGRSAVSGDGSPNGSSRVPSPSTTPFGEKNDAWEAIYAAAGQVARLKYLSRETTSFGFQNRGQISNLPHHAATLFPNQASQMREEHVMMQQCGASVWGRQQQQVKANLFVQQQQQVLNRGRDFGYENVKCTRPSSAWPPLQVQPQNQRVQFTGSGSRPGQPGGSAAAKRGCGGTGVFLPRHYVNKNTEEPPRKKSGFAPVLVPAKVVHALNVTTQSQFSNAFAPDYEALLLARRNALLMQQQRLILRREEAAANYETRLPQEWTY